MKYAVGNNIKFKSEKRRYKIIACDERYLICVKPFNLRPKTYIYTIVDLVEQVRGPDYWVLGKYDYWIPEDVATCLSELQSGECEISRRNRIKLDIEGDADGKAD